MLHTEGDCERGGGGGGGGGRGGGNGGTGGAVPPEPKKPSNFWQCFNNMIDQTSLQNTLHAGNGFLASSFLSNTFGSLVQAAHNALQGNAGGTAASLWSAGGSYVVTPATKLVPDAVMVNPIASVQTTLSVNAVPVAEASATAFEVSAVPIGSLLQGAASGINYFNAPKLAYDFIATLGSAAACLGH